LLTYLLVSYLVSEGLWKIAVSLRSRDRSGYVWLLASGILSLLVGFLIWRQWPLSGTTAVGILIGVNLVTTGIALLAFAHSMRETLQRAIFVVPDTKT
jgi:membrane protein HdeD